MIYIRDHYLKINEIKNWLITKIIINCIVLKKNNKRKKIIMLIKINKVWELIINKMEQ